MRSLRGKDRNSSRAAQDKVRAAVSSAGATYRPCRSTGRDTVRSAGLQRATADASHLSVRSPHGDHGLSRVSTVLRPDNSVYARSRAGNLAVGDIAMLAGYMPVAGEAARRPHCKSSHSDGTREDRPLSDYSSTLASMNAARVANATINAYPCQMCMASNFGPPASYRSAMTQSSVVSDARSLQCRVQTLW